MTDTTYLWNPPAVLSLPVRGTSERLPINRLFFVGRNYHAHGVEMGKPVDCSSLTQTRVVPAQAGTPLLSARR
jgi:fumarylpyruvate hydrolase